MAERKKDVTERKKDVIEHKKVSETIKKMTEQKKKPEGKRESAIRPWHFQMGKNSQKREMPNWLFFTQPHKTCVCVSECVVRVCVHRQEDSAQAPLQQEPPNILWCVCLFVRMSVCARTWVCVAKHSLPLQPQRATATREYAATIWAASSSRCA